MNIQPQSQTRFGDEAGIKDFFFWHRLAHIEIDRVITNAQAFSLPNATLDSQAAVDTWVRQMKADPNIGEEDKRALFDWLQLHATLHQNEYQALGLGQAPDLGVVDFSQQDQFDDWMYQHSAVHDALNTATGTY